MHAIPPLYCAFKIKSAGSEVGFEAFLNVVNVLRSGAVVPGVSCVRRRPQGHCRDIVKPEALC